MEDPLNTGNAAHSGIPVVRICDRCSGTHVELPVLDTRSGKTYRLVRCSNCGFMTWAEERTPQLPRG